MVDVTVVVVTVVAVVVAGCDVDELLGAFVGGGGLLAEVVTVGTWFVVGVLSRVVDVGDGSTAPGSSTDGGLVVRVGPDFRGKVDAVAGGTEVVDVTSSLVVVASSPPGATVVPGSGTLGSAVTEVAPEGRRMPAAEVPIDPTSAWTATAPTSKQATNAQASQPPRGARGGRPRSSARGGPQNSPGDGDMGFSAARPPGSFAFYRLLPARAVANYLRACRCARFGGQPSISLRIRSLKWGLTQVKPGIAAA